MTVFGALSGAKYGAYLNRGTVWNQEPRVYSSTEVKSILGLVSILFPLSGYQALLLGTSG